jgi:hypothetical protein
MDVYKWLENKLPLDIVINRILPYTYEVKPPRLLRDIRSFYEDLHIIDNFYQFDYNDKVLLLDLLIFTKKSFKDISDTIRIIRLLIASMTPTQRTSFINKYIIPYDL